MEAVGEALGDLAPDWVDLSVIDHCLQDYAAGVPGGVGLGAYRAAGVPDHVERVDDGFIDALARDVVARVAASRATALTFGSGEFRTWLYKRAGGDASRTRRDLTVFARHLARRASVSGISVLVEPLNRRESPVWNSLRTCAADLEGVKASLVADRQHTWAEVENPRTPALAQVRVVHLGGPGRSVPDEDDVPAMIAQAVSIPGVERVLWECRWTAPQQVAAVLAASRRTLQRSGR
ncbi:hypothetical protein [Streptomyces sp. CdTB01]|uniref:hypothetical protein n=1 Tax=Streptomyces sp. CdTB01 TaxID=1725411 RepID=UPI00073AD429|nr:hypothetical protein [Streptomyces sp. CdTB01]ALV39160.1 hypothetical protein AS200_44400 [Streptomyces sp. CdTB01]